MRPTLAVLLGLAVAALGEPLLPIPTFGYRAELGSILEAEGLTDGVELGVQSGGFAHKLLTKWRSCRRYVLVDLWGHQQNYADAANVNDAKQEAIFQQMQTTLRPWEQKIQICRNYTLECVHRYPDRSFDFVYVDARHDFKAVLEDLQAWWPKVRQGGIFAGHDYITQLELTEEWLSRPRRARRNPLQNWTLNYDGTVDRTGLVVKGAVDLFARRVRRQVQVSYRDGPFSTWAVRR